MTQDYTKTVRYLIKCCYRCELQYPAWAKEAPTDDEREAAHGILRKYMEMHR